VVFEERVWLHPSSLNFKENKFASPWLVYNECVTTSKPFLRDCSEVAPYAILLFGGGIEVDVAKGTIAVCTPAAAATAAAAAAADVSCRSGAGNGGGAGGGGSGGKSSSGKGGGGGGWTSGAEWCRFSAVPRIAVLLTKLRERLDGLLALKMADPQLEIDRDPAAAAAVRLLVSEGMG
jgi:hypothetical protein